MYFAKIAPKITIFSIKLGGGHLLEHGLLLEVLRYVPEEEIRCIFDDN